MMRTVARVALGLALATGVLAGALVVASRSAAVRELVRARIEATLAGAVDADVRVGRLDGSLGRDLVLEDVRLAVDGRTVVRVPRIAVVYSLPPLLWGELRVASVSVQGLRVRAVRTAAGWRLPGLRPGGGGGMWLRVDVGRLVVEDGRVAVALLDVDPVRRVAATALAIEATASLGRDGAHAELASVRFVPRGIALSPVAASTSIALASDGGVRVSALEVATARSRVAAAGLVEPDRRLEARLRLVPLAAADLRAIAPGIGVVADLRARARVHGPWSHLVGVARAALAPGGTVALSTRLDGRGVVPWAVRARFADLDPGAAVAGLPRATLHGELRTRGRGLDARGPVAYRLALDPSDVAGRQIDRLALGGRVTHAVHRVHVAARGPAGDVAGRARVALGPAPIYRLAARGRVARLDALVPSLEGWAAGRVRAEGRGVDPAARTASVDVALSGAIVEGVALERGAAHVRLADRRVAVETLSLDGDAAHVAGSGALDLGARTATLAVTASADLGAVGRRAGRPLGGRATVSVSVGGPLDALAGNAQATVEQPAYGGVVADTLVARGDLAGLGGPAGSARVHVDAPGLRVGDGKLWTARADLDWRRAGAEDTAHLSASAEEIAGPTHALALTVVRTPTSTRGEIERLEVAAPDGSPWRLASPARFTLDGGLATDGIVVQSGAERIALGGRVALRGRSDAWLTLDRIALARLCALGGAPACGGAFSGRVAITGAADAPTMTFTAHGRDLAVASVAYGTFDVDAGYAERDVRLHATLRHPQAGEVTVDGHVPADLAWAGPRVDVGRAPVALTVRADRLDLTILQALAPHTLRSAAGRLALEVNVSGPRAAPQAEGQLTVDGGRVELIAAGLPYEDIRARITAHGTHVTVVELHARAGDGTMVVAGGAELVPGGPSTVALTVHMDNFFAVRRPAYEAAVGGDLAIRGPLVGPEVTGRLDVERALVRPSALPSSGPTVTHDPTITVVGVPDEAAAEQPSPAPATQLADAVKVAVEVDVKRNAWIRRADANIELSGTLEITKAPHQPLHISGQIRLLRGWYAFQGRRFTIEQGTITFTGATPPKPTFDVTASSRTPDYRVEVRITGSADKPKLTLSSDPPLEQADVLSVLLFGKPASQLGRGQSAALQEQAVQLAAGYVMPELRTSMMEAFGIDTLQFEMPKGTEAGSVSAGRYVAEDVFVSLGQEFGTRNAQVVGLEYSLGRSISVRASTSTRGTSAVDLFWHYRY